MWAFLAKFILRFRLQIIIVVTLLTAFMGWHARNCEITYSYAKLLPENDPESLSYDFFKSKFGQDGNVLVLGIEKSYLNKLDNFNAWFDLGEKYKKTEGVQEIISITRLSNLFLNDSIGQFTFKKILNNKPRNQKELDSIMQFLKTLKFYEGVIFKDSSNATLMAITLDKKILNTEARLELTDNVVKYAKEFSLKTGIDVKFSGLPYIRTKMARKIGGETSFFLLISILVTALILLLFFRSFYAVIVPIIIVVLGVICSIGSIVLMGYKMTVLTGLIPPLMIVIGIPNCILLLNKYQTEFAKHGNKIRAMHTTIERISVSLFFANFTTSIGFAVFCAIENKILFEFGFIASINVMITYIFSLLLIPIIFSWLPPPKTKHLKHLNGKLLNKIISKVNYLVLYKRKVIYVIVTVISIASIYGITLINPLGYVIDDLPKNDPIISDMRYFENCFGGVLPFEIVIDTKREGGVFSDNARALYRMNKVQKIFSQYKEFSKPVSIVEAVKFCYQTYKNGDPKYYRLPNVTELKKIAEYVPAANDKNSIYEILIKNKITNEITWYLSQNKLNNKYSLTSEASNSVKIKGEIQARIIYEKIQSNLKNNNNYIVEKLKFNIFSSFIDAERRTTRISIPVRDIGSIKMKKLLTELKPRIDSAFNFNFEEKKWMEEKDRYEVRLTGFSLMFLKGSDFLIDNLQESVVMAVILIALLMFTLFSSPRMIIISIIPSLVALIITAGIMGFCGIPLKPSTVLVFSIAFGISSDGTLYFLTKYRYEIKRNKLRMKEAVLITIKETGVSMIYTAFVLFFGFGMFALSSFGGTAALGILISFTLLVAYCSNLILLAAFILTLEKSLIRKELIRNVPIIDIDVSEDEEKEIPKKRFPKFRKKRID